MKVGVCEGGCVEEGVVCVRKFKAIRMCQNVRECVLIVVRHTSLGNAQLSASDVGSARPSTTLQRCARREAEFTW